MEVDPTLCNSNHVQRVDLKLVDGAAAGAWIEPRLGGQFGAVTRQVPKGFDAYARIFHPAFDCQGNPVRWAEVAKATGAVPHREMQWHAILGLTNADELQGSYHPGEEGGPKWPVFDPPTGAMDTKTLDVLCKAITENTPDTANCFFGLCTIRGWLDSFSPKELSPLLELPYDRNHIVLAGPLSAIDQITYDWSGALQMPLRDAGGITEPLTDRLPPDSIQRESPNLIWPADHSWFVATEVDFDSTLVGGPAPLIDSLVDSAGLEAWQVEPTDSLAADADKVNLDP